VFSEDLWRRVLASAPDVLQQQVSIDGRSHAIIGVLPRGFILDLGQTVDAWVPLPQDIAAADRGDRNLSIVGRLKRGRSLAEAQTEVSTIAARLAREYPVSNLGTLDQRDQPRAIVVLQHTRRRRHFVRTWRYSAA
jgi:putative ABC transport system permease protein